MNYGKRSTSKKQKSMHSKSAKAGKKASVIFIKAFLVCLLAGYYAALWRGEQHPAETQAHAVLEEKKRIHAGTKIVYQYFYTQDRVMKKHIEPAPEFLIGAGDSAVQHRGDE